MTENECYKLLGFSTTGNPDTVMTIESLTDAIVTAIDLMLVDFTEGFQEFKPLVLRLNCIALRNANQLMFLALDEDRDLVLSDDAMYLFRVFSTDGLLSSVVNLEVVLELERLRGEIVASRIKTNEERERAELARLLLKYGGV
jgi:hypothetical protein